MKNIIKFLHNKDQQIIYEILRLFKHIDKEVKQFKQITGIQCPSQCGICCKSLKIETTALEMMPLACYL